MTEDFRINTLAGLDEGLRVRHIANFPLIKCRADEGSSGACVLAIDKAFSYFGQNCCTLLRAAQEAARGKRSLLRPDWRGM
jgi:hypothetical protein